MQKGLERLRKVEDMIYDVLIKYITHPPATARHERAGITLISNAETQITRITQIDDCNQCKPRYQLSKFVNVN